MSVPVGLINRRNSQSNKINFTRLKLSKNIDLHTKRKTNLCFGGAEEDRTPDPLLAKQVFSQLSYSPLKWWAQKDSNLRPQSYQGCALTN